MGAVESVAPTPTGKLKAHPYNCSAPLGDWGGRNGARESPRAATGASRCDGAALPAATSGATVSTRKEAQCFATLRFKPPTERVR
jgi:hypothetical protein